MADSPIRVPDPTPARDRPARARHDIPVIPVIDLLRGDAVRAVRGDRRNYQPVRSALCEGSDPVVVAQALLEHTASTSLYVADLDALQGGAVQQRVLSRLLQALPATEIWLDAGFAGAPAAASLLASLGTDAGRIRTVFASESLPTRHALLDCFGDGGEGGEHGKSPKAGAGREVARTAALSLDRRDGVRLDAAGCWESPELWPARVIVMTLERVGSDAGPDLETIAEVRRKAPKAMVVGAGGIRHAVDLAAASAAGADAWLVASALHDRRL